MRKLSWENPKMLDVLTHQVIHMDQGITYTPEYIATRQMRHYPSRTAQIIRSVWTGELEASEYGADTVFSSILSGQGERWQNFGENVNDYLLTVMLGREMFYQKGHKTEEVDALLSRVRSNGGMVEKTEEEMAAWRDALPVEESSKTGLLLDEATFSYATDSRKKIGKFLSDKNITLSVWGPYFTGFDLLAAGQIDEGIKTIQNLLNQWKEQGIQTMITLDGQSQYVFSTLLSYLDIETEISFVSILDLADSMDVEDAYIYGGSFFTRYLRKDRKLNELLTNTWEEPILSASEFLPELEADRRRNVVGIWTPPLCAELHPVGVQEGLVEKIYQQSLSAVKETAFKKLVVCDPFAWRALEQHGYPKEKRVYFTDILR